MTNLTKRQHYVPRTYLEAWAQPRGQFAQHDLKEHNICLVSPNNAMVICWYYEEDQTKHDNRVENMLSIAESAAATSLRKLTKAAMRPKSDDVALELMGTLKSRDEIALKEFACYQYLRVPGAIRQKRFEIETTRLTEDEKRHALNPGRFTESGFNHMLPKVRSMKLFLLISPGREFITSDWPCFDIKDAPDTPILGVEIGRDRGVLAYCPLTPRIAMVLVPQEFSYAARTAPPGIALPVSDLIVRNQNALVVQQAERWVVASKEEPYILSIAKKRKKASDA